MSGQRAVSRHGAAAEPPPDAGEERHIEVDWGDECVHHVWVNGAAAEPPPMCLELCLQSLEPHTQVVWVYREAVEEVRARIAKSGVTTVHVRDASELVPPKLVQWMIWQSTPAQWVKDIIAMAALHRCGGWFTDLDVIGIRAVRDWPNKDGYAFSMSPQRQDLFKSKQAEISLSIMRMPRAAVEASLLQSAFTEHATAHARTVASGKREPCEWTARQCTAVSGWLTNQKTLYNIIATSPHLKAAVFTPDVFIPFPIWLAQ